MTLYISWGWGGLGTKGQINRICKPRLYNSSMCVCVGGDYSYMHLDESRKHNPDQWKQVTETIHKVEFRKLNKAQKQIKHYIV